MKNSLTKQNTIQSLQKAVMKDKDDPTLGKLIKRHSIMVNNLNHRFTSTNENGLLNKYISGSGDNSGKLRPYA